MNTLTDFITRTGVTLTAVRTARNPHMDDSESMDNWRCVLRRGRRSMVVHFSKGVGHHGAAPTVDEVLDCLASDAASVENASGFEDWCNDLGYGTDSRKAERTYREIGRQAERLKAVLGDEDYETLLWKTERR